MKLTQRLLMKFGSMVPGKSRIPIYRLSGIKIGNKTNISLGFYVDRPEGVELGNNCFLNHFVHLHNGTDSDSRIILGNGVFVGPEVRFICENHEIGPESKRAGKDIHGSIYVEDGVWIGAGAIILPNVRIAKGGVIGAGALVTKDTEPNGLYVGIPARRIRDL